MSRPAKFDMPASNSRSRSWPRPGMARLFRYERAARVHSTVDKHPVDEDTGGSRPGFELTDSDVAVRFRARGCTGDNGVEADRRSEALLDDLLKLPTGHSFLQGPCCAGGFEASPSALRVALITCLARASFSVM